MSGPVAEGVTIGMPASTVTFSTVGMSSGVPHGPAIAATPSLSMTLVAASWAACGSVLVSSVTSVTLKSLAVPAVLSWSAARFAAVEPGPPKSASWPVSGTRTPSFRSLTSPPPPPLVAEPLSSSSPQPAAMPPTTRAPTARSDAMARRFMRPPSDLVHGPRPGPNRASLRAETPDG